MLGHTGGPLRFLLLSCGCPPILGGGHAPSRTAAKCACRVDPWTPPRRVALPRAPRLCACNPPDRRCVRNFQSKTARYVILFTPSLSPHFCNSVSRSIGVSRSPRCCFRPNTIHLRVKTATKAATDLEAATDLHVATGPSQSTAAEPSRHALVAGGAARPRAPPAPGSLPPILLPPTMHLRCTLVPLALTLHLVRQPIQDRRRPQVRPSKLKNGAAETGAPSHPPRRASEPRTHAKQHPC